MLTAQAVARVRESIEGLEEPEIEFKLEQADPVWWQYVPYTLGLISRPKISMKVRLSVTAKGKDGERFTVAEERDHFIAAPGDTVSVNGPWIINVT